MKGLHRVGLLALVLLMACTVTYAKTSKTYKLGELADQIEKVEKQEIVLTGTIVGVCKGGCKMWVSDGPYKDGDLFALVRAKDDAFKFETAAAGKTCVLKGYAVGEFMDYCAEVAQGREAAEQARKERASGECKAPVNTERAATAAGVTATAGEAAVGETSAEIAVAAKDEVEGRAEGKGETQADASGKASQKKLKDITFFATTVEYK